ncbi:sensor histidine kinase [Mycetocola manganoxydans]|uniref:histidine kinase n=3 Tax=Actinomycetes TaxID=1760 RepID=A0A3L7A0A5_9MICO|nr:sensor histidine kinase [Mycetocola manganoxydans]
MRTERFLPDWDGDVPTFSRRRVVLYQLPLSVTLLVLLVIYAAVSPAELGDPRLHASIIPHVIIVGVCAAVPWGRLPEQLTLLIPLLDMFAIGLSREVDPHVLSAMGLLLVYPVVWLSTAGPVVGPILTVIGSGLALMPSFVLSDDGDHGTVVRPFLLTFVLVAISISTAIVFRALMMKRQQLDVKDAELQTLLRDAEQRERLVNTIVNTVSVGVLALDEHGDSILISHEQQEHMNCAIEPHQTLAASMPIFSGDMITPIPEAAHPISRAAKGETFADQLVWSKRGDDRVALAATARVMTDDAGNFAGSVLAFSDITSLVTALTAKDDFVGNISHELRTPLTSLLGYLELVKDGSFSLPADVTKYLAVAERNAQRLLRLVTDVLAVAADEFTVSPQPTDLAELLEKRVANARPAAASNKVQLILDQPPSLTAYVDTDQISRVVDNLISNAIKFSPAGGTAKVSVRHTAHNAIVEVSDTGIGMSADEQSQAFTKFFRSPTHSKLAIPGVGLGLLTSKSIVESHGGTLTLTSALGTGTTVTVSLPLSQRDS